jgi:hypothetical protein
LNFQFLLFLDHGDVTWDCLKRKVLGEKGGILKYTVLGRRRGAIGTFIVENDRFCFDTPQIFFFVLDFISIKHGILLYL